MYNYYFTSVFIISMFVMSPKVKNASLILSKLKSSGSNSIVTSLIANVSDDRLSSSSSLIKELFI